MPSSRGAKANASSIRALRFSVLWFASSTLSRGAQPKANADFQTVIFQRPGPGEISEILERSATPRMHRKGRIQPARFFVPCVYAQDDSIRQLGDAESGRISRLGSFAPTLRRNDGLFQFSDFRTNTNSAATARFSKQAAAAWVLWQFSDIRTRQTASWPRLGTPKLRGAPCQVKF